MLERRKESWRFWEALRFAQQELFLKKSAQETQGLEPKVLKAKGSGTQGPIWGFGWHV